MALFKKQSKTILLIFRLGTAIHTDYEWSGEGKDIKLLALGRGEFRLSHLKQKIEN